MTDGDENDDDDAETQKMGQGDAETTGKRRRRKRTIKGCYDDGVDLLEEYKAFDWQKQWEGRQANKMVEGKINTLRSTGRFIGSTLKTDLGAQLSEQLFNRADEIVVRKCVLVQVRSSFVEFASEPLKSEILIALKSCPPSVVISMVCTGLHRVFEHNMLSKENVGCLRALWPNQVAGFSMVANTTQYQ